MTETIQDPTPPQARAARRPHGLLGRALRGGVAAVVGTVVMDVVTQAMYDRRSPDVAAREDAAMPEGKEAPQLAAERAAALVGVQLDEETAGRAASAVHWAVGVLPAVGFYGLFGRSLSRLGVMRGLVFGLGLWLVVDEGANTLLGLASAPDAYPTATHLRGLVGHGVHGVVTDGIYAMLDAG